MKNIAVYCGARDGNGEIYKESAREVGNWLVKSGWGLVYGGGHAGLMGAVADAVLAKGGEVIGVIPTFLKEEELAHEGLTKMYEVSDMHERKKMMIDLSQAYLVLPGGLGTLEEVAEVLSWERLGVLKYPCAIYNVGGFYDAFADLCKKMAEEGFLSQSDADKIFISDSLDAIAEFIETYKPSDVILF